MIRLKSTRLAIYALAFASVFLGIGSLVFFRQEEGDNKLPKIRTPDAFANLNLADPECNYLGVRHALETGGNERTRELAIQWLDEQTRHQRPLSDDQETKLIKVLYTNLHASWDVQYRFLFFNSAFEVLHLGSHQEDFTRLLQKLSMKDPEKVMRLYALQHIAIQRSLGHLTGSLADEIRANLYTLASAPASPVAGSALDNLVLWDGVETAPDPKLIELALKIAADSSYSVDVRVTALHATREHSLTLARALAPDRTQPIPLRKASIARIGQHGEAADRASLETLRSENFRMAQAADPALRVIEKRFSQP